MYNLNNPADEPAPERKHEDVLFDMLLDAVTQAESGDSKDAFTTAGDVIALANRWELLPFLGRFMLPLRLQAVGYPLYTELHWAHGMQSISFRNA